ncbi:MAG: GNAT family N-acetyltransferase [Treponemataceae bacterium]
MTMRFADETDVPLILDFIKKLARYEKLEDKVVATEEVLRDQLFVRKGGEVVFAEVEGVPVGFALFFYNFSTFLGMRGIYLEDLYVDESHRGKGYGRALLAYLARLAKERDCGRLDWWVLNWNAPSIAFYKSLGAKPMDEWTTFRLTGAALTALADEGRSGNY